MERLKSETGASPVLSRNCNLSNQEARTTIRLGSPQTSQKGEESYEISSLISLLQAGIFC